MALIKCSECGKSISSDAWTCPNCGKPIKKAASDKKKKRTKYIIILVVLLLLGIGFGIYAYKASEATDQAIRELPYKVRQGLK